VAQDLGWYAYGFGQTQTAVQWFEEALGYDPAFEPAAYGLVVANQKLRDRQRVRALIEQWGPVSDRIRLFGQPGAPTTAPQGFETVPSPRLQPTLLRWEIGSQPMFILAAELTPSQRNALQQCNNYVPPESMSPAAALSRAWCLLDIGRDAEAEAAFRIATLSPSSDIRTDAYYGHTLALLRLNLVDEAAVSASAMPQTAERVQTMQIALLSTSAVVYYQLGRYQDVLQLLDQRRTFAPEENGLLTIRAWSYFHLNRLREAKQIFTAVAATGYQDAQRGLEALDAKGF
jgi:tetratricopeptide (TPR) repeat protein